MTFLNKLGAAVGIGGAKIKLNIPLELHQAEEVTGQVQIVGGNVEQQVQRLIVQLLRFWEESETYVDNDGQTMTRRVPCSDVVTEVQMDGPGEVGPGTDLTSDFHLPVPPECGLTTSSLWYKVVASGEVPSAVDPTDTVDVTLLPAYEVMDLAEAVEKELGWPRSGITESSDPAGGSCITFTVPKALDKYYDYLCLHVLPQEKFLEIRAVINLQEKGFMDYLKAAIGKDNREERYQLAYSDIYDPQNKPIFDPMVAYLRGMIEKYKS